jgi:glycosyltransferase involved in cell wall biosynthesis
MKILYLHQYFKTPLDYGSTRSYWIAKKLVDNGHDVYILTQDMRESGSNERFSSHELIDGINVIYITNRYDNEMGFVRRIFSFLRFMFISIYYIFSISEINLVYASSTPLSIVFPAYLKRIFSGVPFIFEVRDLWPDVPIALGVIRFRPIIYFLKFSERLFYKMSSHIICLSPGMFNIISNSISSNRISVVSNFAKLDFFYPRSRDLSILEKYNIPCSSFKVIHFGAIGDVNGLDNFVQAAYLSFQKYRNSISFILAGYGKHKWRYERFKSEHGLTNLIFSGKLPNHEISELVNCCDVSYIGVIDVPILQFNSANKFFDSLSAGKPVILNFGGWMADIVSERGCGVIVHPNDANDLLGKISFLKRNPTELEMMGANARLLAEQEFDRDLLTEKVLNIVNSLSTN